MRTTIGQLVSELVDEYERRYHDHELATVATSVTLEEILTDAHKARPDGAVRVRRKR